jgi:excisionase family DNA binding protein
MESDINILRDSEPLLRASDIAIRLNISRSLAYKLMQIGEIPTVKIFRSIRVKFSDLEEYINRNWTGWKIPVEELLTK